MEIKVLTISSNKEDWSELATETYIEKIKPFLKFSVQILKSKKIERDDRELKIKKESEALLEQLDSQDFVILCDEKGRGLDSVGFSKKLTAVFDSGKRSVVVVVGGAFGVSSELKSRANLTLKLSEMTMNHLVARTLLLEQIYRAIMIWKNRPYHNE